MHLNHAHICVRLLVPNDSFLRRVVNGVQSDGWVQRRRLARLPTPPFLSVVPFGPWLAIYGWGKPPSLKRCYSPVNSLHCEPARTMLRMFLRTSLSRSILRTHNASQASQPSPASSVVPASQQRAGESSPPTDDDERRRETGYMDTIIASQGPLCI